MKTTQYFQYTRLRPDRAIIKGVTHLTQNDMSLRGRSCSSSEAIRSCLSEIASPPKPSITIEHASASTNVEEFLYQRIPAIAG